MAIHVVKTGETLWTISSIYGISMSSIMSVNGLQSSNAIVPGLALYLPVNKMIDRVYRIKAGDTLWQLAERFSTTLENILFANPALDPVGLVIGQKIIIPSPLKMQLKTLGFIVPYNPSTFLQNMNIFSDKLTYLAVVSYSFTDEGYAYVLLEDREIVKGCKQRNIIPLLMIRNFRGTDFDAELAGTVLENPTYRNNLIKSLLNFISDRGYGGVSIDLEFIPPPRRNDFNVFLKDLKKALGKRILHVNVHSKTEDIPTNRIIGAYDYAAIGRIADIVAVMTIDFGYPTGPPDPVSPAWWVEEVIRYSITQINPRKLQIALPLYGYEKIIPSNETRALSVLGAQSLAIQVGSTIRYDIAAQSPWYSYRSEKLEKIVWFEDIRSYIAKYNLIDLYALLGTTFWQLSLQAPQNWNYMRDHIQVLKP